MQKTLLLNASYEAIRVISWQKAICLWLDRKVEILEEYAVRVYKALDDWSGRMPAVVRLLSYVSLNKQKVKFSRIGVFSRDNFTCQFCGEQPGISELTYDHVLPRSRGGRTCWENIVTACWRCNEKKGDKTPEEARMNLKTLPYKPKARSYTFGLNMPKTPDEWRDYLYWNIPLEHD